MLWYQMLQQKIREKKFNQANYKTKWSFCVCGCGIEAIF